MNDDNDIRAQYDRDGTTEQFIESLRRNDNDAWQVVTEVHLPQLTRYLNFKWRGISMEDREDVVQDVFASVRKTLCERYTFQGRGKFSNWLRGTTRNIALEKLRRARNELSPLDDNSLCVEDDDSGRRLDVQEAFRTLKADIGPDKWKVVKDHIVDGLTYCEIAAKHRISEGAVRMILHRAKILWRRRFERYRDLLDS